MQDTKQHTFQFIKLLVLTLIKLVVLTLIPDSSLKLEQPPPKTRQHSVLHLRCMLPSCALYLQPQCLCNVRWAHLSAAHAEAAAAGRDSSTAQLRQRICRALAHAHVVGGDPGSQAF